MPSYLADPLVIKWWTDEISGEKISVQRLNEQQTIANNRIILTEIPDEFYRVYIDGYTELSYGEIPSASTEFVVNYTLGVLDFYPSEEGKVITINEYYSRGCIYYPSSRIYLESDKWDSNNIKDFTEEIADKYKVTEYLNLNNTNEKVVSQGIQVVICKEGTTINANLLPAGSLIVVE